MEVRIEMTLLCRYRAIVYPLRKKPTKVVSKVTIIVIWLVGLAFALPMGLMHSFDYVLDMTRPFHQVREKNSIKKKCYIYFFNERR